MSEDEQIRAAIQAGLDGIAITDHEQLVPSEHLAELNRRYAPFVIFTGIEVPAHGHHWLVLGLHDPLLEGDGWAYPDLLAYVRSMGGLIALAHPYRYTPWLGVDLDRHTPDAIEVRSSNTPANRENDIRKLASRLKMVPLVNSDAHYSGTIGKYATELPEPVKDDAGLLEALRRLR